MNIDPVEAFLRSVTAAPLRVLIGLTVILLALFLCVMSVFSSEELGITSFSDFVLYLGLAVFTSIGMIFRWGLFGLSFFIGLASLIGMLLGLWLFVARDHGKVCLFIVFTLSCVYFSPITFAGQWYRLAVSYIVILLLLSVFTWFLRRTANMGAKRSN